MQLLKKFKKNLKKILVLKAAVFLFVFPSFAQQNSASQTISWLEKPISNNFFTEQTFFSTENSLPAIQGSIDIPQRQILAVTIAVEQEKNYPIYADFLTKKLIENYQIFIRIR